MRAAAGLFLLHSVFIVRGVLAQEGGRGDLDRARQEARQLLQGIPTSRFLDSLEVERLAEALLEIRSTLPAVASISNYGDPSRMVVFLNEVGERQADTLALEPDSTPRVVRTRSTERIGIVALDSLSQLLGVVSNEVTYLSGRAWQVRPSFSGIANVPVLARVYDSLPEVEFATSEIYIGDGDGIVHFRKRGMWYFVFSRGTGDCPSGCIRRDFYYITYAPDTGAIELVDVLEDGKFDVSKVHMWDIPSRLSIKVYGSYADLLSQAANEQWWVRHHAVAVLDYLVRDPEGPWRGDGLQDRERFLALKEGVEGQWREVLLVLCDRVADEDDWVRTAAHRALVHVAGTDYGEGEGALERWRQWAERQQTRR